MRNLSSPPSRRTHTRAKFLGEATKGAVSLVAMTMDAYAPAVDPKTFALGRLVSTLAEDAIFGLAAGRGSDGLEGLGQRRGPAYAAVLAGQRLNTLTHELDAWIVEMARAAAPVCPPAWLPMGEVLRERVTLEAGARGLRSLFSSKPSDKDVQRVKRLGTFAVRALRAVLAADGPIDGEEQRTLAALIGALGLPDADATPLYAEQAVPAEQLDVYGEIEAPVGKALLRGAWLAAMSDTLDPREEHVIRVVASKLAVPAMDLETLRGETAALVESRKIAGQAIVDGVRFLLADRMPGHGVTLAAHAGSLILPRRYRDEALAPLGQGAKVTLARRFSQLSSEQRQMVLGVTWAAALYEDPTIARRALLRARHERFADDLGEDGGKTRGALEDWMANVLAPAAAPMAKDG